MKELNIEQKAKRYDEAIERAKDMCTTLSDRSISEYIFPELKESEDERIRKELIDFIYDKTDTYELREKSNSWLAWLEKQGEQKPIIKMKSPEESLGVSSKEYSEIVDECIYGEQNPADKVEPKFHEGDWTVSNLDGKARQILEVHYDEYNNYYVVENDARNIEEYDRLHHLWTIKDANEGDVLVHNGCTFIFMGIKNGIVQALEENLLDGVNPVCFGEPDKDGEYHPATKEQRDILFQKMKEAGYEWDTEKKELNKIEQKPAEKVDVLMSLDEAIEHCKEKSRGNNTCALEHKQLKKWLTELKELKEQNPAGSEEDVINYNYALAACMYYGEARGYADTETHQKTIDFLKSLRPQNVWISVDEEIYVKEPVLAQQKVIKEGDVFKGYVICADHTLTPDVYKCYIPINTIMHQNRWKPTDEQMRVLFSEVNAWTRGCTKHKVLDSLYNDLNKLRKE